MIKFFTKIRRGSISGSNFSKYLLYAIGEILLVMIGILLALEVTNWNDERKERALEKELLAEVLYGLEEDLKDVSFNKKEHLRMLKSQNIILAWMGGSGPFPDSLKRHMALSNHFTAFISQDGPYEALKVNGMRIIKNADLRTKITGLYDNAYDSYAIQETFYNNLIMHGLTQVNPQYFEATTPYDLKQKDFVGEMIPVNPETLRSQNAFSHHFKTVVRFNDILIKTSLVPVGKRIEDVIKMIKKELEK